MNEQSKSKSISSIGCELVMNAKAKPTQDIPLSTQLYPYMHIASRTMSLREISEWLLTNHGVKISPMTISTALRSPDLHLSRLADYFEAKFRFVAMATRRDPESFLYYEVSEGEPTPLQEMEMEHRDVWDADEATLYSAIRNLQETWDGIPDEVKSELREHFHFEEYEGIEDMEPKM